jgi:hypothetical protein
MSVVWAWDGYEMLCWVCGGGVFEREDALDSWMGVELWI